MTLLYGFESLKDLAAKRVTEIGVGVVNVAINQSVMEHNRQMTALMGLLAKPVTDFKVTYRTPTAARLSALDEFGRARPIKTVGSYDVSFPIQSGGAAWGTTRIMREKMTVQEASDATSALITADMRWMRDHALAGLFNNSTWAFADDLHGALTIKGPANGDSDIYLVMTGADSGATDDHFKAQAGVIADAANPFNSDYEELTEHPENGGEAVALVATSLKSSIEGLTNYVPVSDPNLQISVTSNKLVGSLGVALPGKLIGYVDKVWICEWKAMPSGYYVMVSTQGEAPLAMRQHPESSLQGFGRVAERNDHPFFESQWERHAGFGAWNRVGAVIRRIGNAAYGIPTNYTVPMY
ncbi:MAG: hypothetical protein WCK35_16755 [Chloroflexota bacterium]